MTALGSGTGARPEIGRGGEERSSVTDVAGATGDGLEAGISVGGCPLRRVDTGGLHESDDRVEEMGIEVARRYLDRADVVLFCIESHSEIGSAEREFLEGLGDVPTVLLARTDANAAGLITSDVDEYDAPFITGERTVEGFFVTRPGIEQAISRGLAYAPHADLLWCETAHPDLAEAQVFADAIKQEYPDQLLAYNCSPSFNWKANLDEATIAKCQQELGAMGYKFQFITLAGFHALNYSMHTLARGYRDRQMAAYVELQEAEFAAEKFGYTATRHQREVGTGYFDALTQAIGGGQSSLSALSGSTEDEQFKKAG